jgi:ATP-dependent DNA helicase DinG
LLKRFQEDRDSVLLGTSSFWEGVDIPGAALELLVITKLPFDVPTEPLVEARIEKVEAEKGNGFMHFSVPEAVVRLKQGFGRLIRSGSDRGVVLLLDHRVVATRYGNLFLRSMPVKHSVCRQEDELMSALQEWYIN